MFFLLKIYACVYFWQRAQCGFLNTKNKRRSYDKRKEWDIFDADNWYVSQRESVFGYTLPRTQQRLCSTDEAGGKSGYALCGWNTATWVSVRNDLGFDSRCRG
jgi:hypothetical protein